MTDQTNTEIITETATPRIKPPRRGPKVFGLFGKRVRSCFDPSTSNANRHKKLTGDNFNGDLGVYGDREQILRNRFESFSGSGED